MTSEVVLETRDLVKELGSRQILKQVSLAARRGEVVGLLSRRVGVLSGGESQQIASVLALGHRTELLVMDEPASGLDPVARRQFMLTLLDIAAETGRTVLFSSHIVSDIERVASHVWI